MDNVSADVVAATLRRIRTVPIDAVFLNEVRRVQIDLTLDSLLTDLRQQIQSAFAPKFVLNKFRLSIERSNGSYAFVTSDEVLQEALDAAKAKGKALKVLVTEEVVKDAKPKKSAAADALFASFLATPAEDSKSTPPPSAGATHSVPAGGDKPKDIVSPPAADSKAAQDSGPKCYKALFRAGKPLPFDFYSCVQCKRKYICANCKVHCHESVGHTLEEQATQHDPGFALCYCKKACCIKNSVTPEELEREEQEAALAEQQKKVTTKADRLAAIAAEEAVAMEVIRQQNEEARQRQIAAEREAERLRERKKQEDVATVLEMFPQLPALVVKEELKSTDVQALVAKLVSTKGMSRVLAKYAKQIAEANSSRPEEKKQLGASTEPADEPLGIDTLREMFPDLTMNDAATAMFTAGGNVQKAVAKLMTERAAKRPSSYSSSSSSSSSSALSSASERITAPYAQQQRQLKDLFPDIPLAAIRGALMGHKGNVEKVMELLSGAEHERQQKDQGADKGDQKGDNDDDDDEKKSSDPSTDTTKSASSAPSGADKSDDKPVDKCDKSDSVMEPVSDASQPKGAVSSDDAVIVASQKSITAVQDFFPQLALSAITSALEKFKDNPQWVIEHFLANPPAQADNDDEKGTSDAAAKTELSPCVAVYGNSSGGKPSAVLCGAVQSGCSGQFAAVVCDIVEESDQLMVTELCTELNEEAADMDSLPKACSSVSDDAAREALQGGGSICILDWQAHDTLMTFASNVFKQAQGVADKAHIPSGWAPKQTSAWMHVLGDKPSTISAQGDGWQMVLYVGVPAAVTFSCVDQPVTIKSGTVLVYPAWATPSLTKNSGDSSSPDMWEEDTSYNYDSFLLHLTS